MIAPSLVFFLSSVSGAGARVSATTAAAAAAAAADAADEADARRLSTGKPAGIDEWEVLA